MQHWPSFTSESLPPESDVDRADLRREDPGPRRWRMSRLTDCSLPSQGELSIEEAIKKRTCLVGVYQKRVSELSDQNPGGIGPGTGGVSPPPVPTEVKHRECLITFDKASNIHSVAWNGTITYKKLRHCYELELLAPTEINIEGLAKEFVNGCINKGLSDQQTRFIVQGLIALGADVLSAGATGGSATATTLVPYMDNVVNKTVECITDVKALSQFVEDKFRKSFSAKVERKSHWIEFQL